MLRSNIIVIIIAMSTVVLLSGPVSACPDALGGYGSVALDLERERLFIPLSYAPFHYQYRSFPYQCGPFPESQKYGPTYDERCVYPYFRQYPVEQPVFTPGPPVRLSDDVTARWSMPNAIALEWKGNPNGVTSVEFALMDLGRVVIHRTLVERPPYVTAVDVPYRAVSVRVRTYGLLQSVLQERVYPLPPHPGLGQ